MKKIYLVLSDGTVFKGESVGADVSAIGEVVFNTSMVGYPELLTDNNYRGQILTLTFPLCGNYGMVFDNGEEKPAVSGLIVKEICDTPSNFRCEGTLSDYLKCHNIPAICGIDTRELTRILREKGTMNGCICETIPSDMNLLESNNLDKKAYGSVKEKTVFGNGKTKVALIDCGTKANAVSVLTNMGAEVAAFPYNASLKDIEAYAPCGIFISDGAGNPEEYTETIALIKDLSCKYQIFATGLGHDILALAKGCKTYKLKYGHRGSNQPSVCLETKKTHITVQNYGYGVCIDSLPEGAKVTFKNANDGTCEGIEYKDKSFSVQFRPEAYTGPGDTLFLFKKFISEISDS